MRPAPRLALGLLALALGAGCLVPARGEDRQPPPEPDKAGAGTVVPGLSPELVRGRLGAPPRVSRQVFLLRCLEQWHYGAPHHLRLTFNCPRGQKPALLSVHSLPAPNR